jgi:hypothetical protein
MFDPKTTKIVKIRKKNMLGGFLAMIFCTIVIASTIGSSLGIRNSFAQTQQVQTQQAPTIAYSSPWTTNLPSINPNSNNLHVLCSHGICDQSLDPGSRTHDNAVLGSSWTNNRPIVNANINTFQVLCSHGICDQSSDSNNRTQDNAALGSSWTNNLPSINKEEMKSILD